MTEHINQIFDRVVHEKLVANARKMFEVSEQLGVLVLIDEHHYLPNSYCKRLLRAAWRERCKTRKLPNVVATWNSWMNLYRQPKVPIEHAIEAFWLKRKAQDGANIELRVPLVKRAEALNALIWTACRVGKGPFSIAPTAAYHEACESGLVSYRRGSEAVFVCATTPKARKDLLTILQREPIREALGFTTNSNEGDKS